MNLVGILRLVLALVLGVTMAAEAQRPARPWRVGFLGDGTAAARAAETLAPIQAGLRELGYVEGRDIVINARWSQGRDALLPELARELVRLNSDVIVTHGVPAARALKAATADIPIVVALAADMVNAGLVASLAHPGGNVTGTSDTVVDIASKEVELIREALPRIKRVGVLWNRANPGAALTAQATLAAAREAGLRVSRLEVGRADDLARAFDAALKERVDAVIVVHDTLTVGQRLRVARLAQERRLPTISATGSYADAGGLLNYGPDQVALFKRAAVFVDKILRGTRPADIPVEQPSRFQLVVNLRTARALGVSVPAAVLQRADRLIE